MIERVVLIKLKPAYATDEHRAAVASATSATLPGAAGVRALRVCTAADARTRRDWDVCIQVAFDDLARAALLVASSAEQADSRSRSGVDQVGDRGREGGR